MKKNHSQSMCEELKNCCNNFQIISTAEQSLELFASFQFSHDFVGFKGHFPGQPVLPAIAQLAMVRIVSEKGLKQELVSVEFKRTKFTAMVQPGDILLVTVKLKQEDNNWLGRFLVTLSDESKVSSGEITLSRKKVGLNGF